VICLLSVAIVCFWLRALSASPVRVFSAFFFQTSVLYAEYIIRKEMDSRNAELNQLPL
jgi:hypothetical protein